MIGFESNENGQLGLGPVDKTDELTYIATVAFKHVACGLHHTVIVDINNDLWPTGHNHFGQLGINTGREDVRNFVKLIHELKFVQM